MKILIISISVIIGLFILFQSFTIISTKKAEEQKYTVVFPGKEFEIRYYPSATLATVYSEAKTYKELSGPGFQKLAGYIFGGNESETKISMTSPVQMDINDTVSEMSFVMPSGYNLDNLPKPNNAKVIIHTTMDEYVAAIKFGGFASDKDIQNYSEKLKNLLIKKGIIYYGNFRFLGYNPPFQLVGRRNEIIVSVKWEKE
ncbi:MAG: heme-binding protein [Mariniphaga sp.]|nr:heme-binding protein [Mariniphaga sp.]